MSSAEAPMARASRPSLARILTALVLFGVSFAYVEAAVVVYLRALYEPVRLRIDPDRPPGELLPLIPLNEFEAQGPEHVRRLATELGREAATLLVLAAVGVAVAGNFRQWFAAFLFTFGLWDIFYYVFLKVLLDWPESLLTWDLLFLLPVPWAGPVLAPVLVALSMVAAGAVALWRESVNQPIQAKWFHWITAVASGVIIVMAFCWDFRNISAGGEPHPFAWSILALGEALGVAAFLHALCSGRRPIS